MKKFIDAAASIGVEIITPIATDGQKQPQRVRLIGNGKSKDGWYYLSLVGNKPTGLIGNWKTGERVEVKSSGGFDGLSRAELDYLKLIRAQAKRDEQEQHDQASKAAIEYFDSLPNCPVDHPYLISKGVAPHGAKFDEEDGSLVIPVFNVSGQQMSWQKIWDESQKGGSGKLFLKGGKKKGCFYHIQGKNNNSVYVCEGFATGCSINEATDCGVFVAFDAGNLQPVITELKKHFSNTPRQIIVASDNDHKKEKNIGLEKAKATGETVVFPEGIEGTDFNDLHTEKGLQAVSYALQIDVCAVKVQTASDIKNDNLTTHLGGLENVSGLFDTGMAALMSDGMPSIKQYAFPVVAAMLARAISGKITCQGVWPNIYAIKVGPTSSGKTESDKEIASQLVNAGMTDFVGITDVASGPGLYRALEEHPITMFAMDEATGIFRKYGKNDQIADGKRDALMDVFSSSGRAIKKNYGNAKNSINIDCPCLTFVGNTTPLIFDNVTIDDFRSGLVPRFDFFCYDGKVPYRGIKKDENKKLSSFIEGVRLIENSSSPGGNLGGILRPVNISMTDDCKKLLSDFSTYITDTINTMDNNALHTGIISRKYHGAIKYAMIHIAGTRRPEAIYDDMTSRNLQWGVDVVNMLGNWKIDVLNQRIITGDFHAACLLFLDAIKAATRTKQRPTFKFLVNRRPELRNWKRQESEEVIAILVKRGEIILDDSKRKTAYFLPCAV